MFLYKVFNTGKLQAVPLPPLLTVPLKPLLELGHSSLFSPFPLILPEPGSATRKPPIS